MVVIFHSIIIIIIYILLGFAPVAPGIMLLPAAYWWQVTIPRPSYINFYINFYYPRADGAKRRARVLIPPGYLHPGKRKY
jgi:hypothetical protein